MTVIVLAALVLAGLLLYALAEATFDAVFEYIGTGVVWLLTFGNIQMDPLRGGESELAKHLGVLFAAAFAYGVSSLLLRG